MSDNPKVASPKRMKAYALVEAVKGETHFITHGTSLADARERFKRGERGQAVESYVDPAGIRSIRRMPEEDPDAR